MTLTDKKALVADFLTKCNAYADAKLADYRGRLAATADPEAALALQDKIGHWTAYRTFNMHTLGELERDTLDAWFEDAAAQ